MHVCITHGIMKRYEDEEITLRQMGIENVSSVDSTTTTTMDFELGNSSDPGAGPSGTISTSYQASLKVEDDEKPAPMSMRLISGLPDYQPQRNQDKVDLPYWVYNPKACKIAGIEPSFDRRHFRAKNCGNCARCRRPACWEREEVRRKHNFFIFYF